MILSSVQAPRVRHAGVWKDHQNAEPGPHGHEGRQEETETDLNDPALSNPANIISQCCSVLRFVSAAIGLASVRSKVAHSLLRTATFTNIHRHNVDIFAAKLPITAERQI